MIGLWKALGRRTQGGLRKTPGPRAVLLAEGADRNGFATMVASLVEQNVVGRPDKLRALQGLRGRVALLVEDAKVSVTVDGTTGPLLIHDGIVGIPDVTIRASSEDITRMSLMELVPGLGVPNPRGPVTREVLSASRHGRIQVFGAATHPATVLRLTQVLSVN